MAKLVYIGDTQANNSFKRKMTLVFSYSRVEKPGVLAGPITLTSVVQIHPLL